MRQRLYVCVWGGGGGWGGEGGGLEKVNIDVDLVCTS